ncbi:MAG TPA: pyridoxal-dependent decarboxylase [Thermoanaerobaculia bacterium]|nr:pyridoxal-dependent decarboxylase [Thermoanaerobaculia bacterium]
MSESPLDPDVEEFRRAGYQAVDWIAEYFEGIRDLRVLSNVEPGEIAARFASVAPEQGRSLDALLEDFREKVLPGVTHWNHPRFFAYFAITGSQAGILGELLSAALNVNGMLWRTSPSATEMEQVTIEWLRALLGLPEGLFGIINDTASINSFLALAAAREALGLEIREKGMSGRNLPPLRVYCSDQAHSSIDKAALALGFGMEGVRRIESDASYRMRPDRLAEAIEEDRSNGARPCAIVATLGTTSTASIDPLPEIGAMARAEGVWLHVDAAYGGPAMMLEEQSGLRGGLEFADSIVVNPHKWLFTPVDCSVLYTRRPDLLRQTFSLIHDYLQTTEEVVNFMDYGLQLGRRFRAIKLWMVLEHYGATRLRKRVREHIGYAARLAEEIDSMEGVDLLAPRSLSVTVFRRIVRDGKGNVDEEKSERASVALLETINGSGRCYVSHTRLRGRYGIRVAIGNGMTLWEDVDQLLEMIRADVRDGSVSVT